MDEQRTIEQQAVANRRGEQLRVLRQIRIGDPIERLLLRELDDRIGTGKSWEMSVDELAAQAEIGSRTCRYKLAELEAKGVLAVEKLVDGRYRFTLGRRNLSECCSDAGMPLEPAEDAPTVFPRRRVQHSARGASAPGAEESAPGAEESAPGAEESAPGATPQLLSAPSAPKRSGAQGVKSAEPTSADSCTPTEEELVTAWNAVPGVAPVRRLNADRRRKLKARRGDDGWRENWKRALDEIPKSPFLRGENDRGWRATIDWFLRPATVDKILEGQYAGNGRADDRKQHGARYDPSQGERTL